MCSVNTKDKDIIIKYVNNYTMRPSYIVVLYLSRSFLFAYYAPHEVKPENGNKGWQMGIIASPVYALPYNASISRVHFVKSFKLEPSVGFSASVSVSKNLNEHFQIESGIGYFTYRYESMHDLGPFRVNNPNDDVYQNLILEKREYSNLDYLQVPIRLNYLAGKGRVKFIGSFGVSPGWVVSRSKTLSEIFTKGGYASFVDLDKEKKSDINLFGEAGLGMIFRASEKVSFQFMARYSFGFIKFENNELFGGYDSRTKDWEENAVYNPGISALGLSVGCFYGFRK